MNPEIAKLNQKGLAPIPGHSLTNDPNNPMPFERPPEYTDVHEAIRFLWGNLIENDTYIQIIDLLERRTPLMDIVEGILFTGFSEGKWDSNLMLLLTEPLAYMLLALCERINLDPVFIDEDEEANENFESKTQGMSLNKKIETTNLENMENNLKSAPEGILPSDVAEDIENIPQTQIESLLSERKSLLSQ